MGGMGGGFEGIDFSKFGAGPEAPAGGEEEEEEEEEEDEDDGGEDDPDMPGLDGRAPASAGAQAEKSGKAVIEEVE
jgi:hypothetical protein